ncbi:hypothetical protein DPEC_G00192110, partial [Dallia pectoralis]
MPPSVPLYAGIGTSPVSGEVDAAGVSQCQGRILRSQNFEDATSSTSVEGLFQCRGSSEFQPRTSPSFGKYAMYTKGCICVAFALSYPGAKICYQLWGGQLYSIFSEAIPEGGHPYYCCNCKR